MRRVWASAAHYAQPVRAYGGLFRPTLLALQRGNQGRYGGDYNNNSNNGGGRYGGPPQRGRGGASSGRSQNYGDRQQGFGNNRERGFNNDNNRERGFNNDNNRERGFNNNNNTHGRGYSNNRGRGRGDGGRGGGFGGRPPRANASDYFKQDAERLLQMKQASKQSKSEKERVQILREARRCIRRVHIDPSTQDEKSVMVYLNCAAAFGARPCEGLEEAVRWVQFNAGALSPQNVALFANALGLISVEQRVEIMRGTVVPLLPSLMREMTPVEVVMVLQAFQRLRIREHDELKDALLLQLEPCISSMPVPQLSTLAEVLSRHMLRESNPEKWRALVQAVMDRALQFVETMHSKEALTFLIAVPKLVVPEEQVRGLLARVTTTAGFHTHEQVADLLRVLYSLRGAYPNPTPELKAAVAALQKALIVRLEKVSMFADTDTGGAILQYAALTDTDLPSAVTDTLFHAITKTVTHRSQTVRQLARLAKGLGATAAPPAALLEMVAKYAIGERPPRPQHNDDGADEAHEDAAAAEELRAMRADQQELSYARKFDTYVTLRLNLEDAYAKAGVSPVEALATTLPEHLVQHLHEAEPRCLLSALIVILTHPTHSVCRNVANDEAIYQGVLADIAEHPERYNNKLKPLLTARVEKLVAGHPKGEEVVKALKRVSE